MSRRVYLGFALLFIIEAAAAVWLQTTETRHSDIVIHLNNAVRLLQGDKLYRDMITVNFPMIYYLRVPGVWIAQMFALDNATVALLFDNAMAALSIALTLLLLRKSGFSTPVLLLIAAVLIHLMCIFPAEVPIMGEKEYFFWLFTLPYFFLAALNVNASRPLRIFIGLLASIGFCMKPFFVFPLLLVEGYACWQARSLKPLKRPEFLACTAFGVVYVLWMICFLPEYFTMITAIGKGYYTLSPPLSFMLRHYIHHVLPFFLPVLLLLLYVRYSEPVHTRLFYVLTLAYAGCVLASLAQMKVFFYQLYAGWTFPMLLIALLMTPMSAKRPVPRKALLSMSAGAFLVMLVQSLYLSMTVPVPPPSWNFFFDHLDKEYETDYGRKPASFYKAGYMGVPMFPDAIARGLPWNYHFYNLWPLQAVTSIRVQNIGVPAAEIQAKTLPIEEFTRKLVVDDLLRVKPDILLVDQLPTSDMIKFLEVDERFTDLMRHYLLKEKVLGSVVYAREDNPIAPEDRVQREMKWQGKVSFVPPVSSPPSEEQ